MYNIMKHELKPIVFCLLDCKYEQKINYAANSFNLTMKRVF